jgi:hypothetical protein
MNNDEKQTTLPPDAVAAVHRLAERLDAESFVDPADAPADLPEAAEPVTFLVHTAGLAITLWKLRETLSGRLITRDIAQLRYESTLERWSLWQSLSPDQWQPACGISEDPVPASTRIEPLLMAIYDNAGLIFWGFPAERNSSPQTAMR